MAGGCQTRYACRASTICTGGRRRTSSPVCFIQTTQHPGVSLSRLVVPVRAEFAEGFQDRAIRPVDPQGAVIADVVRVFAERILDLDALRRFDDDGRFDQATPDGGQPGLAVSGPVGGGEGIGADRLALALSPIPEFEKAAAFGVGFISVIDHNMIAADAALAVEQGWGKDPFFVEFWSTAAQMALSAAVGFCTNSAIPTRHGTCRMASTSVTLQQWMGHRDIASTMIY